MKNIIVIVSAVVLPMAWALPQVITTSTSAATLPTATVTVIPAQIDGPKLSALSAAPANLDNDTKALLDKYQPRSHEASRFIGAKNDSHFSSAGLCFKKYPCFSVTNAGKAMIGSSPFPTKDQISNLIDHLLSQPTVQFDDGSNPSTILTGTKISLNGLNLEMIAPRGSMPSGPAAGMVFDMYKLLGQDLQNNAIRAVQASTDNQEKPLVAMCFYPSSADATEAQNFCIGKQLDGSSMPATQSSTKMAKRFSLDSILTTFCHSLEIPILCE